MGIEQTEPNLIEMPVGKDGNIASPVNLSCSAVGYPPPSYQWYKDGVPIPGETQAVLYIPELLPSDRGDYVCRANNTVGEMSSDFARVEIPGICIESVK